MPGRHPNGYTPLPDNLYTTPPHQAAGYPGFNPAGPGQASAPSLHSSNQPQKMIPGYTYSSGEGRGWVVQSFDTSSPSSLLIVADRTMGHIPFLLCM